MTPRPTAPTFEHHANGRLGIGEQAPRLSWQVPEASAGYVQHAAEVEVVVTASDGASATSVHELAGPDQILVPWPAVPLRSRQTASVRLRVFDGIGWGPWGFQGTIEVGLLEEADWVAAFVGPEVEDGSVDTPPGRLRTEFDLPDTPRRARLYLSTHGLAEAEVNGIRVGDEELTPGWTSYRHRLRYATFDVTDLLTPGRNAIGVWLGDGWWRGRLGFRGGVTKHYGDHLAALVQLEVTTERDELVVVATDGTWMAGPGPILASGLYEGERFDLRLHDPSWSRAGWPTVGWAHAQVYRNEAPLVAPTGPPVRCVWRSCGR